MYFWQIRVSVPSRAITHYPLESEWLRVDIGIYSQMGREAFCLEDPLAGILENVVVESEAVQRTIDLLRQANEKDQDLKCIEASYHDEEGELPF